MQFKMKDLNSTSITHSPYYGCTIQVISNANISYIGVLDSISINKDRLYLKNAQVKANIIDNSDRDNMVEELGELNAIMINHLTNDMYIYEQICLNVHDIQQLKVIRLPSTFHESKAKLHAIDPCFIDVYGSSFDQYNRRSYEHDLPAPIGSRSRYESTESNDSDALISSNSNESSSSFINLNRNQFVDNDHNEIFNEQIKKFSQLSTTTKRIRPKPATLVAKKVLPKTIEPNNSRSFSAQNHESGRTSTEINNINKMKKSSSDSHRKASPIRVTITSKLNPNAAPFYSQQRSRHANENSRIKFYGRNRFQPRFPSVILPVRSQSSTSGTCGINPVVHQSRSHPYHFQQRFISPRQISRKNNLHNQSSPLTTNFRTYSLPYFKKQFHPQHQWSTHERAPGLMDGTSSSSSTPSKRERLSAPINNRPRCSSAILCSTSSSPYRYGNSGNRGQLQASLSFGELISCCYSPTYPMSGTSSGSNLNATVGSHSIIQMDSISNNGQYDFERANEEFRYYLELEELAGRHVLSTCNNGSFPDDSLNQSHTKAYLYKNDSSFFDRMSCTATTDTALASTEMDETEKNLQTFGDDAFVAGLNLNENE